MALSDLVDVKVAFFFNLAFLLIGLYYIYDENYVYGIPAVLFAAVSMYYDRVAYNDIKAGKKVPWAVAWGG